MAERDARQDSQRDTRRANRWTAFLLWGIVALFFFGVMAKYYWLVK